jgi:hypothetical protein
MAPVVKRSSLIETEDDRRGHDRESDAVRDEEQHVVTG